MVSDQTIHLWNRAIHLVTQKHRNMERRQSWGYEERHFKVVREMCFTGATKSSLLLLNLQCLSLLVKTASSSSCPGGCLGARLPSRAERPSFSAPNPAPEKLACAAFTVMKPRRAGRPAQWQQEEPVCSQLLALTAGLLRGIGMSSRLRSVGRKRLISARLPFRDSTAQALFHLQMIKWSTGQLGTEGRNSWLSPGFLNQHDWISQRKAAVAAAGSMTFPEKCSPV